MIMTQCDKYNSIYRTEERVSNCWGRRSQGSGQRSLHKGDFREDIEGRIGALQTSNSNFKITALN